MSRVVQVNGYRYPTTKVWHKDITLFHGSNIEMDVHRLTSWLTYWLRLNLTDWDWLTDWQLNLKLKQKMYVVWWNKKKWYLLAEQLLLLGLIYCQTSNIDCTKYQNLNVSGLVLQLSLLIYWTQVLSWEWRCSRSSADRWCSNYIWVINNFIAYWGASYIRGLQYL